MISASVLNRAARRFVAIVQVTGICLFVVFAGASTVRSQESEGESTVGRTKEPRAVTRYMGRRVAPAMGYMHMNWLSRPERIQEENPQEMLGQLGLQDGMVVCDLGCGDGYHTLQIAPRVGPSGKVIAVDIQPQMLQELSRKMAERKVRKHRYHLGDLWDPKLAPNSVDLV